MSESPDFIMVSISKFSKTQTISSSRMTTDIHAITAD